MPVFSLELPKTEGGLPVKITNGDAKKDSMEFIDNLDTYGTYKFKGKVAAPYLKAQGLPVDTLDNPMWTHTLSDKVAKAVVEWCKAKGATMATHWFQPLGSAGVRRAPCPTQPPRGLGRCGRQRAPGKASARSSAGRPPASASLGPLADVFRLGRPVRALLGALLSL